jgi:hypothetical protein
MSPGHIYPRDIPRMMCPQDILGINILRISQGQYYPRDIPRIGMSSGCPEDVLS